MLIRRYRVATVARKGITVGRAVVITGRLQVHAHKGSSILLADNVVLNSRVSRNSLEARGPMIIKTLFPGARISIGAESGVTSSTISAAGTITIGARVLIGAGCVITDSDHHVVRPPVGVSRRHLGLPRVSDVHGVTIEDDVFIGARSIILKGVTIGRGSVIGAGSVVARDIAPNTVAAGNPCVPISKLEV
ncbi:acyltransferase [Microbacterium testaceum]|uniref:acyltransferase n=1 Tax=Microbacterium testaceum TaxID=2033 RepID=UPI0023DE149C|nr:DapH/DapD/GlmU-related protein [Microbacterium testaceum]